MDRFILTNDHIVVRLVFSPVRSDGRLKCLLKRLYASGVIGGESGTWKRRRNRRASREARSNMVSLDSWRAPSTAHETFERTLAGTTHLPAVPAKYGVDRAR